MKEMEEKKAPECGEKEIDLLELAARLWANRRKIVVWGAVGAVVGLIIAFSIPKEYTASAKLAPESGSSSGGLGALMSMAGVGGGSNAEDAVYPELYPDVVSSIPFLTSLFDVEVETQKDGRKLTLQEYLKKQKVPWWKLVMSIPGKLIGLFKENEPESTGHALDNFRLTPTENSQVIDLKSCINTSFNQATSVITIDVTMQDPLVTAMLADSVVERLQEFITDYRTNKARKDLEYAEKINKEAQGDYYRAQKALADYSDRNQGIATLSASITRDRLENETSLAFTLYNQTSQRVQAAKAMVQEKTPVYAVIVPPTVPIMPSSPHKLLITVVCTFLGAFACCVWILFLQPMVAARKKQE